jgi:hypothetical protein
MRPLTEALLRGNAENLEKQGWKPSEQRRCFKKADALLDYIAKIKPAEYVQQTWYKKLNELRVEGIKYYLQKDMPSLVMQKRTLEVLFMLLNIGEDMMQRAAWLYRNCPGLFKAKYAQSPQIFEKDSHFYFLKDHIVPKNSFPPFKKGENPATSSDKAFLSRAVQMYLDPIFETSQYQEFAQLPTQKKFPYAQWLKTKAGTRFSSEHRALCDEIKQLHLMTDVKSNLNKQLNNLVLAEKQKKYKTT